MKRQPSAGKDYDGEREQGATLARCKWTGQVALVLRPATDGEDDIVEDPRPGEGPCTLLLHASPLPARVGWLYTRGTL